MTKWVVIGIILFFIALGMMTSTKQQRMKSCFEKFQTTHNYQQRRKIIAQGKSIMDPKLLPYILSSYRDESDIEFTVAMIGLCQAHEDNDVLRAAVQDESLGRQVRIICMAQLFGRGYIDILGEVTDEDIEMIAISMPVHIIHWKQLLLNYSGKPRSLLNRDTFPERRIFKALFRDCISLHNVRELKKQMRLKQEAAMTNMVDSAESNNVPLLSE